jgi:hypothetical protein
MKTALNDNTLFSYITKSNSERRFFPLGNRALINSEELRHKISGDNKNKVEAIWGTLGWMDNSPFQVDGEIAFSEKGQTEGSKGATLEQISDLYDITPGLSVANPATRVRERYINLSDLKFGLPAEFSIDSLPELRLTLFLDQNEGALVYYQHSDRKDYNDVEAFIEYVMPEKTDPNHSFSRDRLNYSIPIVPAKELIDLENGKYRLSDGITKTSFIIKVLTFIRPGGNADEGFQKAIDKINLKAKAFDKSYSAIHELSGKLKYRLSLFKPGIEHERDGIPCGGDFVEVDEHNKIDPNKKTLLLLHGTWASTYGSFEHLVYRKGFRNTEPSFLQTALDDGHFEQILSFDRPTMSADVHTNVDHFLEFLKEVHFTNPIDVITTSQGALVGHLLSCRDDVSNHFMINRIMMFSPAFGCGYFKAAKRLGTIISVIKKLVSPTFAKILLAALQYSIDWFINNPGLEQMHPDSQNLRRLLQMTPKNPDTTYINVVCDWHRKVITGRLKLVKRAPAVLLDAVIKTMLGKEHDWVIGCDAQSIVPTHVTSKKKIELTCLHGRYFDLGHVLDSRGRDTITHNIILEGLSN